MQKELAKQQTIKRFTNLLDGKVLPRTSVSMIIDHYESLIIGKNTVLSNSGNIESNFIEDEINEIELNEADYWDGDETSHFSYGC